MWGTLQSVAGAVWSNPYGQTLGKRALDAITGGWSGFFSDAYEAVWEDGLSPSANPHFINNGFDDNWSLKTLAFFNANRLRAAKSFLELIPGQEILVKSNAAHQANKNYNALKAMADKLHDRSRLAEMLKQMMTMKEKQAALATATASADLSSMAWFSPGMAWSGYMASVAAEVETSRASEYYGQEIAALSEWLHWRAFTEMRVGRGQADGPALRICRELAKGSLGYDALNIENFIPEPKGHWVIAHNLNAF